MSEGAFHGLSRYHSAPSSFLAALADSREEDLFHVPSDPNARESQALLASLFSEDFSPSLPRQQPGVVIQPLPPNPHLLQPYSLPVQNPPRSSATLACDSLQLSVGNTMAGEDFLCENKSWNNQPSDTQALMNSTSSLLQSLSPVVAAGTTTLPPSSSLLPLTPPKTAIVRQSSSPATFFNQLSGEFQMSARQKFSHRLRAPLSVSYELDEPCLGEESSDEFDGDSPGQSAQLPFCRKRSRSDISQQLGTISEIAGGSDLSIEGSARLLSSNTTPCLARAKRGCATHPRSISEREIADP